MLFPRGFSILLSSLARTERQDILRVCGKTLLGDATVNRTFHNVRTLKKPLATFASQHQSKTRWRLLDVQGLKELLESYKKLSKFKLSAFVVSTACTGYILGSGSDVDWSGLGWTALGTMGAAACANSLNQIMEVKNDGMMGRTRLRPLPAGKMSRAHALVFAVAAGVSGVGILSWKLNDLTAGLGAANIALYAGLYTPLKQITPFNTWVGAVVGAIPPLMGWAASSGNLEPGSFVLAGALYFWQIPHFLSLAWLCREDYMRAGYEMLSKYDASGRRLALIALRNSLYMLPLGVVGGALGLTTTAFGYEAGILSLSLGLASAVLCQKPSKTLARALFKTSLVYLPVFMLAMLVHRKPNLHEVTWDNVCGRIASQFLAYKLRMAGEEVVDECDSGLGVHDLLPAPFPFVPIPLVVQEGNLIWEGLDEVIAEEEVFLKCNKKR